MKVYIIIEEFSPGTPQVIRGVYSRHEDAANKVVELQSESHPHLRFNIVEWEVL